MGLEGFKPGASNAEVVGRWGCEDAIGFEVWGLGWFAPPLQLYSTSPPRIRPHTPRKRPESTVDCVPAQEGKLVSPKHSTHPTPSHPPCHTTGARCCLRSTVYLL